VALILLSGALASWPLISYRSGYAATAIYLIKVIETTGARLSLGENSIGHSLGTVLPYYLLRKYESRLSADVKEKIGYFETSDLAVLDFRAFKKPSGNTNILEIAKRLKPVFQTPNMSKPLVTVHFHRVGDIAAFDRVGDIPRSEGLMPYISVFDERSPHNKQD